MVDFDLAKLRDDLGDDKFSKRASGELAELKSLLANISHALLPSPHTSPTETLSAAAISSHSSEKRVVSHVSNAPKILLTFLMKVVKKVFSFFGNSITSDH